MHLTDLKNKPIEELQALARSLNIENTGRSLKQNLVFSILKAHAKSGGPIYGDGVIEVLQDGFGFLRSGDSSYLAGPDDLYVSPSQIRRFGLRTGDTVAGRIRPPKEGERYFAILKVDSVNFEDPESVQHSCWLGWLGSPIWVHLGLQGSHEVPVRACAVVWDFLLAKLGRQTRLHRHGLAAATH